MYICVCTGLCRCLCMCACTPLLLSEHKCTRALWSACVLCLPIHLRVCMCVHIGTYARGCVYALQCAYVLSIGAQTSTYSRRVSTTNNMRYAPSPSPPISELFDAPRSASARAQLLSCLTLVTPVAFCGWPDKLDWKEKHGSLCMQGESCAHVWAGFCACIGQPC